MIDFIKIKIYKGVDLVTKPTTDYTKIDGIDIEGSTTEVK